MESIRFLKHAVVHGKTRTRVHYAGGEYIGSMKGTITIYAKDYSGRLPRSIKPENDSDISTDLYGKDRARITPRSKYYSQVRKFVR